MRDIIFEYGFENHGPLKYTLQQIEFGLDFSETGNVTCRRQYTGLKDANGVMIFEGDIVQGFDRDGNNKGRPLLIVFHKGAFCVDYGYVGARPLSVIDRVAWRVIGNIHQHPHLLEQQ